MQTRIHRFLVLWITFSILAAATPIDSPGEESPERFSLEIVPSEIEPGGVLKIGIRDMRNETISAEGSLGDQELIFQRGGDSSGLVSIAGIDLEVSPGPIDLTVYVRTRDGDADVIRSRVTVGERTFGEQRLTIEEKPYTPERLDRIEREAKLFRALWNSVTPERYWSASFAQPVPSITVTSEFGLKRFINEVPRRSHTGIDLRAATGDTIYATNDGRVALTGDFYFNGKSIVIDHGEGLYSMYFHLSEPIVGEGDVVRRGQAIGLAGSTGRSTAPHLHWGLNLRGARIDPLKILELPI